MGRDRLRPRTGRRRRRDRLRERRLAEGPESVRLLADFYHMARDGEPADEIAKHGGLLAHCHVAEAEKRTPPGVAGDDFGPYLRALKAAGYDGALSIECRWSDFETEAPAAVRYLRDRLADAGY